MYPLTLGYRFGGEVTSLPNFQSLELSVVTYKDCIASDVVSATSSIIIVFGLRVTFEVAFASGEKVGTVGRDTTDSRSLVLLSSSDQSCRGCQKHPPRKPRVTLPLFPAQELCGIQIVAEQTNRGGGTQPWFYKSWY